MSALQCSDCGDHYEAGPNDDDDDMCVQSAHANEACIASLRQQRDAALAAQKQAEERAERYRRALVKVQWRVDVDEAPDDYSEALDWWNECVNTARSALASQPADERGEEPECDCGGARDGDRHESWCKGAALEAAKEKKR